MARLTQHSKVAARIVLQNHCQVHAIFVVALNGFDDGDLACEREIKNVGACPRTQSERDLRA